MSIQHGAFGSLYKLDDLLGQTYEEHEIKEESPTVNWDDTKGLDPRLKRLSYSSSLLMNGCLRKYQLQKLQAAPSEESQDDWKQSLTFQFGHTVGEGIQETLVGKLSREEIVFKLFMNWSCDLFDENEKQKKSFFHGLAAITKFWSMQDDGFFEDYEVAYYDGKPAAELSFRINFPDGSSYRGYVDLVLKSKVTGEYVILELKTNSGRVINHYQYKNSAQAIGYSVVLDKIAPGYTNYTVEYLVYMTFLERWEQFSFPKTYTQRALWVRDRLWDVQTLQRLHQQEGSYGIWPSNGAHCVNYNKNCEFMGMCHMNTENLVAPLREKDLVEETGNDGEPYQFEFNVADLL